MIPSMPARSASRAVSMAKAVVNSAMPARMGTRPRDHFLRRLHDRDLLRPGQRAVLPDGAADDEAGDPVAQQPLDDPLGRLDIEAEILAKLGRHRGKYAVPTDMPGHGTSLG